MNLWTSIKHLGLEFRFTLKMQNISVSFSETSSKGTEKFHIEEGSSIKENLEEESLGRSENVSIVMGAIISESLKMVFDLEKGFFIAMNTKLLVIGVEIDWKEKL